MVDNTVVRQALKEALESMPILDGLPRQRPSVEYLIGRLKGLGQPVEGHIYTFCAKNADGADWGEFCGYDLLWSECAGDWRNWLKAKLVLEYQREPDESQIVSDFQGLLWTRADLRVLVFQVQGGAAEAASRIKGFKQQIATFDRHSGTASGEYMFACFCQGPGGWHFDSA